MTVDAGTNSQDVQYASSSPDSERCCSEPSSTSDYYNIIIMRMNSNGQSLL